MNVLNKTNILNKFKSFRQNYLNFNFKKIKGRGLSTLKNQINFKDQFDRKRKEEKVEAP